MKLEIKEDITTDFNEVERSIRENFKDTKKNKITQCNGIYRRNV